MFTDGMSRLAVGVSVMVALSLALFFTIVVLLLADLLCSHLRRRAAMGEERPKPSPPHTAADDASVATTTLTTHEALSSTPPFYYAHGVMAAPPNPKDHLLAIPTAMWTTRWSPARRSTPSRPESTRSSSSAHGDGFVRISNPVYERGAAASGGDTPDASPSTPRQEGRKFSPPMSVMRKLPPLGVVACPPPAFGFFDGQPSTLAAWSGTAVDTNRASSSSSNFTTHFFSS